MWSGTVLCCAVKVHFHGLGAVTVSQRNSAEGLSGSDHNGPILHPSIHPLLLGPMATHGLHAGMAGPLKDLFVQVFES